jgi:tetratricopeptide (TPR) repeat protein
MDPTTGGPPLPPPQFVGTSEVLERAAEAVTSSPGGAIALTGSPGSGKSAMAARLVSMLDDRFDGEPIWLSCEGEVGRRVEAADLANAILGRLGHALPASADPAASIEAAKEALSDERRLLVFDDVSDEGQIWDLLPSRSDSAAIVISRDGLSRLPIPHFELGPLPMPAAIRLLREAAGNPAALEDLALCESLVEAAAGLPLTIRLLSAQIAGGTDPFQLLRLLRDESTRRSFVESEFASNSMRSAVAATAGSLSPQGEALLGFLSLMNEDIITPRDLHLELGTSRVVEDGLRELLRLSLLEMAEDGSYRMHPAVRRFAREQLGEEELDALANRLVPSQLSSKVLEKLRQEAIGEPAAGQLSDHIEAQEYALRVAAGSGDRLGEATALGNLGALYRDRGHFEDATAAFQAALDASEAIDDESGAARVRLNLGNVAHAQGQLGNAEVYYRRALEGLAATGDADVRGGASILLGDVLAATDREDEAAVLYDEVHRSAPAGSDLANRALGRAARLAERDGDFDRARVLYESALEGKEISDAERADLTLRSAVLDLREGDGWRAANRLDRSAALFRRAGNINGAVRAALLSGAIAVTGDEIEMAETRFEEADQLLGDAENPRLSGLVAFALALLDAKRERGEEARDLLERALARFRELDDALGEALALLALGPLIEAFGDHGEAATVAALARDKLAELGMEELAPELGLIQMALRGD